MLTGAATGAAFLSDRARAHSDKKKKGSLPVEQIEQILQADGTVSDGVLSVEIDRDDLSAQLPGGIPVLPAAELNGTLYFQPLDDDRAILNGDFCLKPSETNPFIDALIANGLIVQAFHQHLFDLDPVFWFIHFRGVGDPVALAKAARKAIGVTSVPLPQHSPKNPSTPFDVKRLAKILGGSAEVGDSGVVTVTTDRANTVTLGGVKLSPETGISTETVFQPLDSSGKNALVVPDFSMTSREIQPVFARMRSMGWIVGCLYNQETAEHPQLFFSHQWKVGDPYALAKEVRKGLELTDVEFKS